MQEYAFMVANEDGTVIVCDGFRPCNPSTVSQRIAWHANDNGGAYDILHADYNSKLGEWTLLLERPRLSGLQKQMRDLYTAPAPQPAETAAGVGE